MEKKISFLYTWYDAKDNSLYTGYTNDILKRVEKHNSGTEQNILRQTFSLLVYFEEFPAIRSIKKNMK